MPHRPCHRRQHRVGKSQRHRGSEQRPRPPRNLILGANYLQSHILHFYHLAGQDFIQGPDTAPFMPRYAKPDLRLPPAINAVGVDQYVEALEVRAVCHEMVALFGGRMPSRARHPCRRRR